MAGGSFASRGTVVTMRVAVTGGIAEGKTTVVRYLAELGFQTASSDQFARECFQEPDVQRQLAKILDSDEPVVPARLRAAIESSSSVRRQVNRVMHPGVVSRIQASKAQFIEVPLLIEACLHPLFDQVWVVTCGPEEQLRRLRERDGTSPVGTLVESQLSSFAKTPFGDVVVRTNLPLETVKRFVWHAAKHAFGLEIARFEG